MILEVNHIPCTDIYFGLNIKKIINISKLAYIQYGSCDITNNKLCLISLLGIDNYFRTYIYDEEWQAASTLLLGIENLKIVVNSLDIKDPFAIITPSIPMINSKQYVVSLPLQQSFLSKLNKDSEMLVSLFS